MIKGLRFGILLHGSPTKTNTAPYQHSLALNNIGPNFITDALTFWFYLPFFKKRKIISAVALCRLSDTLILAPAFLYVANIKHGLWSWLFFASVIWGSIALVVLLATERSALKKLAPTFALSVLAYLTEISAASLFFYFHRGADAQGWAWGLKNLMDSFLRGPHDAYHWFYLSHFVIAFASLITTSYRKE